MLRCASSFPGFRRGRLAAYETVRLTPQDRERNPEVPLTGRRGAMKAMLFLTGTCRTKCGMSIARLTCGLFTKSSHFHDFYDFLRSRHTLKEKISGFAPLVSLFGFDAGGFDDFADLLLLRLPERVEFRARASDKA